MNLHLIWWLILIAAHAASVRKSDELESRLRHLEREVQKRNSKTKVPVGDPNSPGSLADQVKVASKNRIFLNKVEQAAVNKMIGSADCNFESQSTTRLRPPNCREAESNKFYLCSGSAKCVLPGLTFRVLARCFADSPANCPSANECALKTYLDSKDKYGDFTEPSFGTMWGGGYAIEPKK